MSKSTAPTDEPTDEPTTESTDNVTASKQPSVETIAEMHDESPERARTRLWAARGSRSWGGR